MSRVLKIAVVTQFPKEPDRPVGGVEAVSVNLVRELARDKTLDIQVVTLDESTTTNDSRSMLNATVHFLPQPAGSMLTMATGKGRQAILSFLDTLRPDLVHAHDTYGLMVQGYQGPRVFTVHGFIHGDTRISGTRFAALRAQLWKFFETRAWADQPNIISISPYVRELVSRYSRACIRDIDNPVAREFFDLQWRPKPHTIFSAAVISPRKNTLRLIEACHRLQQQGQSVQLRLAGPIIDAAYGELIKAYINTHGLQQCVHLLGSLPSSEVRDELCTASVFALVSLEENSPMGIEEAMAVGLPVVSSNRCGMPYMIRHGVSGLLIDPDDPDDIANALRRILGNQQTRDDLGAFGRRIALDRFHPAVVAARTTDFYRELI
jgi:glycosyltransferase involved in cell wall biosynthesis